MEELEHLTEKVADLIIRSKRIVVFTGAGVSTESGIPDFRSPGGIWERYDPEDFTIQKFLSNAEVRRKIWGMLASEFLKDFQPNPAHYAIAELEKMGKLECVITQNVDNLHQMAGNSKVLELHGNMRWVICLDCHQRYPIKEIRERVKAGEIEPDCPNCGGILKPDAVFFGEALPQRELMEATLYSRNCDLFISIGSTLVVYPAAFMPRYAIEAGAKLVIINLTSTPMDRFATVIIRQKAGEVLPKIIEKVKAKLEKGGQDEHY